MKRISIFAISAVFLLSSCGTYTGSGAYTGSTLGAILGSAIGGISDGPRGHDVGTIVGMAGGAVLGSVIGASADRKAEQDVHDHYQKVMADKARNNATYDNYDSGFDASNSGDDRIYDFNGTDYTGNYSAQQPSSYLPGSSSVEELTTGYRYTPNLEIRNARFVDDNRDNIISRGEVCKVIFEVINNGSQTVYDVQPTVVEASGNKQIFISPNMHVESIAPGKGIRYTAVVKAGNRLKNGTAKFCVSVLQGDNAISKVTEFNIPTRR